MERWRERLWLQAQRMDQPGSNFCSFGQELFVWRVNCVELCFVRFLDVQHKYIQLSTIVNGFSNLLTTCRCLVEVGVTATDHVELGRWHPIPSFQLQRFFWFGMLIGIEPYWNSKETKCWLPSWEREHNHSTIPTYNHQERLQTKTIHGPKVQLFCVASYSLL